jgi:NAD(P) transhydrogenase subunit alpha
MKIFVPKETEKTERRIPLVPEAAGKLVKLGAEVVIEAGLGKSIGIEDSAFTDAGATTTKDRSEALGQADIVLRLNEPDIAEVALLKKGSIHISYLNPFYSADLIRALAAQGVSAICMEMIPRSTIAQKMDALSSQANLGGYVAVVLAADRLDQVFPMMMTPSGTISPSRVFIIGAGVAGLQAIATAKRMGARVDAFDTRPVVEEQVKSLGAKFVKVDLGETGQTKDGYAKELTPEQIEKQREAMAKFCATADVVITTAQVFGRKAPVIVTKDMVKGMKPGSVIVDMAVETGGNVEGSKLDKETTVNGVHILGYGNLPGRVPVHASQMYANNLVSLLDHFWDKENATFNLDREDEIIQGSLLTHDGAICNEKIKSHIEPQEG